MQIWITAVFVPMQFVGRFLFEAHEGFFLSIVGPPIIIIGAALSFDCSAVLISSISIV